MLWKSKGNKAIYLQLMEQIGLKIISGTFKSGERLPSVREMASEVSVNPNTMQRALSELEKSGLVYSKGTSGRFITEDEDKLLSLKKDFAIERAEEFLNTMNNIGFTKEESIDILQGLKGEKNNE